MSENEKLTLFGAADVFVSVVDNPQETYGLVLLEAMAAGLPVVAAEWNGYRELVRHGETGFLVPTYWTDTAADQDRLAALHLPTLGTTADLHESVAVDLEELTRSLELLVRDGALRARLGEAGRRVCVRDYDCVDLGRRMVEVFDDLVREARSHPWPPAAGSPLPFADRLGRRFAHYPTCMVTGREWIRRPSHEPGTPSAPTLLRMVDPGSPTEHERLARLVSEVPGTDRVRLDSLVARLTADWGCSSERARQQVLRCVKYGLLALDRS